MSSPFCTLPLDLLSEILEHLEWNNLLDVRLVSKAFLAATQDRSIWISLFQKYSSYEPRTLWPDRNISDYTAKELEDLILCWQGVDLGWSTPGIAPSSQNTLALSEGAQAVQLIPGGRWLAAGMSSGDIHIYDLLSSNTAPTLLIPVSLAQASSCKMRVKLSIDMEDDKFVFAFKLAVLLLPVPTRLGDGESVYVPADSCFLRVYRVTVDQTEAGSHDLQAELLASHIHKSHTISYCYALSLLHNQIAYSIHHRAEGRTTFDSDLFVIDWTKHPENEMRSLPGVYAGWIRLLPGNRLLSRTPTTYELRSVDGASQEDPLVWSSHLKSSKISQPFFTRDSTRFVVLGLESVMGLIVPHGGLDSKQPQFITLQEGKFKGFAAALGYNHGVTVQNWLDTTHFRYSWPDEKPRSESAKKPHAVKKSSYEYPKIFIDQSSGRLISLNLSLGAARTTIYTAQYTAFLQM